MLFAVVLFTLLFNSLKLVYGETIMANEKKLFSSINKVAIGTLAGAALMLMPASAMAGEGHDHGSGDHEHGDHAESGDKSCNGDKGCKGDKGCDGDKGCSGDKGCKGEKGGDHDCPSEKH